MAYISTWRFARTTPRKAQLLAELIRGKPVGEALDLLTFSKQRAATMLAKTLRSAVANADEAEAEVEDLYVCRCFCNAGPTVKRFAPKDRGKSYRILKRTCHITVEVDEGAERLKPRRKVRRRPAAPPASQASLAAAPQEASPPSASAVRLGESPSSRAAA